MKTRLIDLTGQRFGRLVVIERADDYVSPKGKHVTMWTCKCDCGNVKNVPRNSLLRHNTRSCGCLCKETSKNNIEKVLENKKHKAINNQEMENINNSMTVNKNVAEHHERIVFTEVYPKFENWLNQQEDRSIEIKSVMLWSALHFAKDMGLIEDQDTMKMYGEFMFKQMKL